MRRAGQERPPEQYARCPKAYRLRNLLGFEPPLARELGYGRAVHAVLRALAELARTHGRVPAEPEAEALLEREFYLPFANAASLPPMKAAARALIQAYRQQFGEDLLRTWDTERPFTLTLPGALVQGRADVILDGEGGEAQALALADYKTAVDELNLDQFQLAVYAAAAHDEGLSVRAAYIHDLSAGAGNGRNGGEVRRSVPVGAVEIEAARKRAGDIVKEIAGGRFPARPARNSCQRCDVQPVCGDALTRAARAAG